MGCGVSNKVAHLYLSLFRNGLSVCILNNFFDFKYIHIFTSAIETLLDIHFAIDIAVNIKWLFVFCHIGLRSTWIKMVETV